MLIFIAGLPATGKTTLAEALARRTGALHYNTDKMRGALDMWGRYSPEDKDAVYQALLEATESALSRGRNLIVDATFTQARWRNLFEALAQQYNTPFWWVLMEASPENIYSRMQHKRKYSEADYRAYERIRGEYHDFVRPHLVLHSDAHSVNDLVENVLEYSSVPHWDDRFNKHPTA